MHFSVITACKITWKEESLPLITKAGSAFSQKKSCIALFPESLATVRPISSGRKHSPKRILVQTRFFQ